MKLVLALVSSLLLLGACQSMSGANRTMPPDQAKGVADLVATTDGIIFHLWGHDEKVPSGNVIIAQSVGHVNLSEADFKKGASDRPPPKAADRPPQN